MNCNANRIKIMIHPETEISCCVFQNTFLFEISFVPTYTYNMRTIMSQYMANPDVPFRKIRRTHFPRANGYNVQMYCRHRTIILRCKSVSVVTQVWSVYWLQFEFKFNRKKKFVPLGYYTMPANVGF